MVVAGDLPLPNPGAPSARVASPANPSAKEEGEISSGENAELPTIIAAFNNKEISEPILVSSRNKLVRYSSTGHTSLVPNTKFHTSNKKYYRKTLKTKQIPFKSINNRTLSWHKKVSDDNLVIRFSDDDSGTDSGDSKSVASIEKNDHAARLLKFKMPITSSHRQEMLQQSTLHDEGFMSKKGVAGPAFSNIGKTNGSKFGNQISSSDKVEDIQKQIAALKTSIGQVNGNFQDTSLADTAAESLRHKISPRENECKVQTKTLFESVDIVSGSTNNGFEQPNQKLGNQAIHSDGAKAANAKRLPLGVRPTKRLKVDRPLEPVHASDDALRFQKYSNTHLEGSHQPLLKGQSGFFAVRSGLNCDETKKTLSLSNEGIGRKHGQVNENAAICFKAPHIGAKETILPLSCATLSPYSDPDMNSKQEAKNDITADASCSYAKSAMGPVLLASDVLDQSSYLVQQVPGVEERVPEWGIFSLESLLELEQSQDRELEEAQEFRRRCELKERLALKAYRKAQKDLINANKKCAILYRNRETITAKLQTLMLESSNSVWRSSKQGHAERIHSKFGYHVPAEGQASEVLYDKNHGLLNEASLDVSLRMMNKHGSCSNQYSEHDDNKSDHREKNATNGLSIPVSFPNMSTDDDKENLVFDKRDVESNLACSPNVENHAEGSYDLDTKKEGNSHDYDLEAVLRSKLVAKFGMKTFCKNDDMSSVPCQVHHAVNNNKKRSNTSVNQQIQQQTIIQICNSEDPARVEGIMKLSSVKHCDQSQRNEFSSEVEAQKTDNPKEGSSFLKVSHWLICRSILSPSSSILHNVLPLVKFIVISYHNRDTEEKGAWPVHESQKVFCKPDKIDAYTRESGTGSMCDILIDPFWPFCMFELRGKCNNDECPWQHVKQNTKRSLKRGLLVAPKSDSYFHTLTAEMLQNGLEPTHGFSKDFLPIPAYYIGASLVKVESHFYHSVLARSMWKYWQPGFSASFAIPFSFQRILPQDAPFLQIGDGAMVDYDNWSSQSWYLQSHNAKTKRIIQGLPDSDQSLELALSLFCGKFYKSEKKKAFAILSRAIESDPSSTILWVVYLHIFYMKEKGIGKDDMLLHAVQHNSSSYDLWLMYVNSRVKLDDRLNAYNNALRTLCQVKLTCDKEKRSRSAHVLDIFLQMVDCLRMCGNVDKAVQRICQLVSSSDSDLSSDSMLPELLSFLTVPDKCIFLICCVYVVMYKKLPQEVVHNFELEKDFPFSIEWPLIQLTIEETNMVGNLMKFAIGKVGLDADAAPQRSDRTALRSLHFLAVSHVRLSAILYGLQHSEELLVKYIELYPTCLELLLFKVRSQGNCKFDAFWQGFQEILDIWPAEVPGIQCLWNQCLEHALLQGNDCAEKLIAQWFQQFGELNNPQFRIICDENVGLCRSSKQQLVVESTDNHTEVDEKMFALLNLSLHRLSNNDVERAFSAVDEALKLCSAKYYDHCLREHTAMSLLKESEFQSNTRLTMLCLLRNYVADTRFFRTLELLSRQYYKTIRKPRIRHLIDEIMGSVPGDFSLINSVLEVCYGPTFIPETIESKELVDFVETLMALTPANYQLALSVYRFTTRNFCDSGTAYDGIIFWASSILLNSIFQAVPAAPENVWIEAADLLGNSVAKGVAERFYQQALSVYPFSLKLWKSYFDLAKLMGKTDAVIEAARERGLEMNIDPYY
ncbi:uncharacterized protein LOC122040680 isoform X1 [Zingiber officinale]|uniref:uncharacterized protein LOC122040680 isoform X1 n=2 Tax=Zingiber officinale TaxID=94328 RepID=UPI001C4CDD50|nr:uncharacterized protein LOC122040680 isoform X1 [Zingiber officinale]